MCDSRMGTSGCAIFSERNVSSGFVLLILRACFWGVRFFCWAVTSQNDVQACDVTIGGRPLFYASVSHARGNMGPRSVLVSCFLQCGPALGEQNRTLCHMRATGRLI